MPDLIFEQMFLSELEQQEHRISKPACTLKES
jgi:hypothetical protein